MNHIISEVDRVFDIEELFDMVCTYLPLISILNLVKSINKPLPVNYLDPLIKDFVKYRDGYFDYREECRPKLLKKWLRSTKKSNLIFFFVNQEHHLQK